MPAGKEVAAVVALLVAVAALAATPGTAQGMSCSVVYNYLSPCISYFSIGGGAVPQPCCNGVRQLLAASRTGADLRTACGCLKNLARGVSGQTLKLAAAIPSKCGVNLPYKISPTFDCSTIR